MAADTGSKRKHEGSFTSNRKSKKAKRATIQEPNVSSKTATVVRVSQVVKPKFAAPVVATTPGLCIPELVQFNSFTRTKSKSFKKAARQMADPSAEMMLHSSGHQAVEFTGKEDKSQSADAALNHYIGIFDPATGQLQVVAAKKMEIRGRVRAREASEEQVRGTAVERARMDQRNELGQTFGTKKARKAIQSITENAIATRTRNEDGSFRAVEMGAGDKVLIQAMKKETATMSTREELQAAVDRAKPLPRGNYDAVAIEDVYVPDQIIGADVLAAIPVRDWQQTVNAGKELKVYSRFVAQRVTAMAARGDGAADQLRLLRYLYWLILYWQTTRPGKERGTKRQLPREKLRAQMDDAPEAVVENIRRLFTEHGTLRKFHMDLLMTHCCAFACIVDNFEVNMVDLREDLRLDQKQMAQYFAEIGARIKVVKTADRVNYVAKLQLPLQFPNSMRRRKR